MFLSYLENCSQRNFEGNRFSNFSHCVKSVQIQNTPQLDTFHAVSISHFFQTLASSKSPSDRPNVTVVY